MFFALSLLVCASETPSTLTIIGTADLHGRMAVLPLFAGYLANVRADRTRAVLLVDAGDAMQGTLESDLDETLRPIRDGIADILRKHPPPSKRPVVCRWWSQA